MDCFLRIEVWPGVPEPKRRVLRHVLFKRPYKIRTAEALLMAPPTVLLEVRPAASAASHAVACTWDLVTWTSSVPTA